jgi:ketosteroid isomerase-like protein
MSDSEAGFSTPEAAEEAFYMAFADCDIQAMAKVWAMSEVICIHPGSTALVGYDAVMRSWTNILTNAEPPNMRIEVLSRYVSIDLAVHLVEEHIKPGEGTPGTTLVVLATNIYRREQDEWRILEHHASLPRSSQRQPTLQ